MHAPSAHELLLLDLDRELEQAQHDEIVQDRRSDWQGNAWPGEAWRGPARPGEARLGEARRGQAGRGMAQASTRVVEGPHMGPAGPALGAAGPASVGPAVPPEASAEEGRGDASASQPVPPPDPTERPRMKLERVTKRVFLGDDDSTSVAVTSNGRSADLAISGPAQYHSIYFRLADVERIRDMFNALLVEARS